MFAGLAQQKALNAEKARDLASAWKYSNEAVSIMEESAKLHGTHRLPQLLICRSGIALQLGRVNVAQADAERAIRILREGDKLETSSGNFGRAYLALGRALKAQGKETDAHELFQISARHLRNAFGPDHPDTWSAYELASADTHTVAAAHRSNY
jgi:tetratricopeptide (TPR) repeat protein